MRNSIYKSKTKPGGSLVKDTGARLIDIVLVTTTTFHHMMLLDNPSR
jgi:hypothetical protein